MVAIPNQKRELDAQRTRLFLFPLRLFVGRTHKPCILRGSETSWFELTVLVVFVFKTRIKNAIGGPVLDSPFHSTMPDSSGSSPSGNALRFSVASKEMITTRIVVLVDPSCPAAVLHIVIAV